MYKLTKTNGFDFYSNTINYRKAIGTIIRIKDYDPKEAGVCGRGLHASRNPNDCFVGARIPCAAFHVVGINKIVGDSKKVRYQGLKIIEEIHNLDKLFGWNYSEVINPFNPFKIKAHEVNANVLQLLKEWNSVYNSVRYSVLDSVGGFVGGLIRGSVWDSVWDSIWDSEMKVNKRSIYTSIWNSIYGYIGSLFPNIKKWRNFKHKKGVYPFQSGVDLWKMGLVPSYDEKVWRLHAGENAQIVWKGNI